MKKYYKLLAAVLALTMVAVIGVSSVAASAPTGSITVNNAVAGQEYELYRIFDLTGSNPDASGDYQNVAYSIATKWAGFFAAGQPGAGYLVDNPGTNNYPTVAYNGAVKYIALNSGNVADFALAALSYISNVANDGRQTASTTSLTFSGLPLGYYLVYPVGATDNVGQYTSIASLTSTTPNATVVSKATPPIIEKDAIYGRFAPENYHSRHRSKCIADGSFCGIAACLAERYAPYPCGKEAWSNSAIKSILTNEKDRGGLWD